jgi:hypothetical protein
VKTHVVKQGEHLSLIAESYGFVSSDTIWMHPDNADLRELRSSPNVLFAGDELAIPDKQQKQVECSTGSLHRFVLDESEVRLRLRFLDLARQPIPEAQAQADFGTPDAEQTDGDGLLTILVGRSERGGRVVLERGPVDVFIGHLDPVEEETGVRGRLSNLGYLIGEIEDADDVEELSFALEEFQADYELAVTKEIDDATRAKLVEIHGS